MTVEEFAEVYAEDCRDRELEVLKKLRPHISIADRKKTVFITLVTKQDLWWNNRHNVKQNYMNGDYEQIVQAIRHQKGAANFIHEYRSASLVMENLVSGANELLLPTTAGYDQRLKFTNFKHFLSTIEALFEISLRFEED